MLLTAQIPGNHELRRKGSLKVTGMQSVPKGDPEVLLAPAAWEGMALGQQAWHGLRGRFFPVSHNAWWSRCLGREGR